MLLALALLASSATPMVGNTRLDRLVLDCDRIVRARIKDVHEFGTERLADKGASERSRQEPRARVLELEVEQLFWGDPKVTSLFVLDDDANWSPMRDHGPLEKGEETIWFLERYPSPESLSAALHEKLDPLAGNVGIQVPALYGRGRVRIEEGSQQPVVCLEQGAWSLPDNLTSVGEHTTQGPEEKRWMQVPRDAFEAWLRDSLLRTVPGIEVEMVCTAPLGPGRVTLDPQGHAKRSSPYDPGDNIADIGSGGLRAILELATKERFAELPPRLGHSRSPDSTWYRVRIRSESGGQLLRIDGPSDPSRDSEQQLDEYQRAKKIFDAIPLARDWKITGD